MRFLSSSQCLWRNWAMSKQHPLLFSIDKNYNNSKVNKKNCLLSLLHIIYSTSMSTGGKNKSGRKSWNQITKTKVLREKKKGFFSHQGKNGCHFIGEIFNPNLQSRSIRYLNDQNVSLFSATWSFMKLRKEMKISFVVFFFFKQIGHLLHNICVCFIVIWTKKRKTIH